MKNLKSIMAGVALMALSVPAMASGDSPAKPMKTADMMKSEICNDLCDLKLIDFNLTDETVDVYFNVDAEGNLKVEKVEGANCLVTSYVSQMLENKKIFVSEDLQNVSHHYEIALRGIVQKL